MVNCSGLISGSHINPTTSCRVWLSGRMPLGEMIGYIVAQVIGAILGSTIIYALVKSGAQPLYDTVALGELTTTGANGFGSGMLCAALIAEVAFTFIFVLVVLGSTDSKKGAGNLAGLAIGLTLVLVHIVCIPITGTSVNPARSTGPALFAGGEALSQLWVFWVAPLAGAALAALVWKCIGGCCCKDSCEK